MVVRDDSLLDLDLLPAAKMSDSELCGEGVLTLVLWSANEGIDDANSCTLVPTHVPGSMLPIRKKTKY